MFKLFSFLLICLAVVLAQKSDLLALVPKTGVAPGVKGCSGERDSDGVKGVKIPCECPPTDEELAAKTIEQNGDKFPGGSSNQDAIVRSQLTLATLQTFKCPASSTTILARLKAIGG